MSFTRLREQMVAEQLIPRKIVDPAVLEAMRTVPREAFVPERLRPYSYEDGPLPIEEGQTISQPFIVALMAQSAELTKESICLEIGTGSGYSAAILGRLAKEIYTIERIASLTEQAEKTLKKLSYTNVHVKTGDGTLGWPEHAPYDAIIVTAGAPAPPDSFLSQLTIGGRVIIPVGDLSFQQLLRLRKISATRYEEEVLEAVRFVPLIGEEGWP